MEQIESNNQTASNGRSDRIDEPSWEYQLRKYLVLLATLVATATYTAGLAPPGGVWQETNTEEEHKAGDPILYNTGRYLAFYYFNATAFAASLVVNLLLLVLNKAKSGYSGGYSRLFETLVLNEKRPAWLAVLRFVMVLDLLGLMGAYATGSCRDKPTTVYASALVVILAAYVGVHVILASYASSEHSQVVREENPQDSLKLKEQRKVLMLLATFTTGITYAAGLSPPGGFRDDTEGGKKAGDPMLQAHQSPRLMAFFYCNTAAFVASLFVIVLLLSRRLRRTYIDKVQSAARYGFTLVSLFGLLGAYAAGSSRKADTTSYVIALVGAVLAYIFLVMVVIVLASDPLKNSSSWRLKSISASTSTWLRERGCHHGDQQNNTERDGQHNPSPARELLAASDGGQGSNVDQVNASNASEGLEKAKSLVLLLATLAATITYQAGLDPPGGVWPEDGRQQGHKAGDPILLSTDAKRYKVFFYCNSTAFVASLVVILMVKSKSLVKRHTLEVVMILDLLGLIGAYAAGSCRDVSTSIYVVALAGAVLVYVVIHVVFFTLDQKEMSDEEKQKLEKRRKRLLLLAILVATITYQSGLTPPGGFWQQEDQQAGFPILHDTYSRRYEAFFYCNATSFMASVALIILLVNPTLYRPGIRCYALYVCMAVALFGLMGAYAAGSARLVRTSIYVFVLVGAVIAFIVVLLVFFFFIFSDTNKEDKSSRRSGTDNRTNESSRPGGGARNAKESSRQKYLMLLAILAASVTYQAGLDPPGSVWQAEHAEGNPVMHDRHRGRYRAFFYSNSTSFVASVVVIVLLLQESLQNHGLLLYAMNTAIVLDLLGLLGAYAAGSSRDWETSGYVIALVAAVLAYIKIHLVLWFLSRKAQGGSRVTHLQPSHQEEGDSH